jgi:hypothetical protein
LNVSPGALPPVDQLPGFRRRVCLVPEERQIRCNGRWLLGWSDEPKAWPEYNRIVEPPQLAGQSLEKLRPWIRSLAPELQEAARLLQWCAIVANGRRLPLERHANASLMGTGRCFSFQEERAGQARRILDIRDFSNQDSQLLARLT